MDLITDEELISSLSYGLSQNKRNAVQGGLKYLFANPRIWEQRRIPGLSSRTFNTFREFVIHETPWGLEWRVEVAKAFMLPELPEIWAAMEGDIPEANEVGVNQHTGRGVYIHGTAKGTSRARSIAVLKRDAPAIAKRVISGKISAAEGMRQAGKREKKITIDANIDGFAKAIKKVLTPKQIVELIKLLK